MSETYLNGEVKALQQARQRAQETLNRLDRALAALAPSPSPKRINSRKPRVGAEMRERAVQEYLGGATSYEVAPRYGVTHRAVLSWVRAAGHRVRPAHRFNGASVPAAPVSVE